MDKKEKMNFIKLMINSNVLQFGDFVTKSGRKTPYFINSGNYNTGMQINELTKYYADLIIEKEVEFDAMFGPAYKGIPLVTLTAAQYYLKTKKDKPFFFNRKEEKDHGEGGVVIGYKPKDNEKIIIIEDVITAGTAISEVIPQLKSIANIKCENMFISVNRKEKGKDLKTTAINEVYDKYGIKVHYIVDVMDIREFIKETEEYKEYLDKMDDYMSKYCII